MIAVYGARGLIGKSYDEAAREYLGRPAREERDEDLDGFLGIRLDRESGRLVDPAAESAEEEGPDAA